MNKDVLNKIAAFVKEHGRYPKRTEYKALGFTRDQMRNSVVSMENAQVLLAGELEKSILDLNNHKYNTKVKKVKRYLITTAVLGAKVDDKFMKNLQVAAEHYSAEIIIGLAYPSTGQKDAILDVKLKPFTIITEDSFLNENIMLLGVKSGAKATDPIRGKATIGQREETLITFSPKQFLNYVPTGPDKLPKAIMSPGTVTLPDYKFKGLMPDLSAYKANLDHVMGAIIVEIKNDKIYHFRQIQADANGNFVDLNTFFRGGKISKMLPEAMVLGDWHCGETNPKVKTVTFDMIDKLKPRKIFLHDLYDGKSVNPHEAGQQILLAKRADAGELSLSKEFDLVASELKDFLSTKSKIYVVPSNHDEFLDRYLQKSTFVKHPYNYLECLDLVEAVAKGEIPLQVAIEKRGVKSKNLIWLRRNDMLTVAGIHLSAHGDRGANGSKGTPNTLEQAYINCVVGHAHSPRIVRGVYIVGTSTDLTPHYGPGQASSWMNTHCLIYPNGNRQLINIIEGEWRL